MWHLVLLFLIKEIHGQIGADTNPVKFKSVMMSSASFDTFKIEEISFQNGSTNYCAALCVHSKICSRFLFDGQKCHLLEHWQFLKEDQGNGSVIEVAELFIPEWSQVLIIGGDEETHVSRVVEAIDLKTMKVCPKPPELPRSRYAASAFFMAGNIHHAFGAGSDGLFNFSVQFSVQSQSWKRFGYLEGAAIWYSGLAQIRDSWVLLISGTNSPNTYIMYWNGTILPGPPLPIQIERHCAIGVDMDHIFVAGGQNYPDFNTETYVLKWSDQVWIRQQPMISEIPRENACEAYLDGDDEINIIVGSNTFEIFNWASRSWRQGPTLMTDPFQGKFTRFNGLLYFFGRSETTPILNGNSVNLFNPKTEKWSKATLDFPLIGKDDFGLVKIPPGIIDC